MITKFNLYNESLRDHMKPKSEEEVERNKQKLLNDVAKVALEKYPGIFYGLEDAKIIFSDKFDKFLTEYSDNDNNLERVVDVFIEDEVYSDDTKYIDQFTDVLVSKISNYVVKHFPKLFKDYNHAYKYFKDYGIILWDNYMDDLNLDFGDFIKDLNLHESLRDQMVGKSIKDIKNALDGESDNDIRKKFLRAMWKQIKIEVQEEFEDAIFHREERTVYSSTYYISDKYNDEDNLDKIYNKINQYGNICVKSSYNGHSAIKIRTSDDN